MSKRRSGLSYQHPLLLWAGLMGLLALAFAAGAYQLYRAEVGKIRESNERTADTYQIVTLGVLDSLDTLLKRAGRQYLDHPGAENRWLIEQILRERKATNPQIMDLLVADADGAIAVWTGPGKIPAITDRDYIRHHLDNPHSTLYVGVPTLSWVHPGRWFMALSRAVRDDRGGLRGIAVGLIDLAALEAEFASRVRRPGRSVALIHQDGQLVLRVPRVAVGPGADIGALRGLAFPIRERLQLDVPAGLDGQRRLATLLPLPDLPLLVSATSTLDEARGAGWRALSILAGLWLVTGAVGLVFARRLARTFNSERRAQALYQSLLDGVSDAIYLVAVEDGGRTFRFLAVNPACERGAGLFAAEMVGRTPEVVWGREQGELFTARYRACIARGERLVSEDELDLPTGRRTWLTTLEPIIEGGQVRLIVGVSRDTTEQASFTAKLRSITDNLPGFVYQLYRSPAGEFRYVFASENAGAIFGVSAEVVVADADSLLGLIHPDDIERVMAESLDTAARGVPWHSRFRMVLGDGRTLWLEARDTPVTHADGGILWTGYANDVTEVVALEEALRHSEAKFRMFVERASDLIFTVSPEGVLTYVSPNWTDILGHPVERVVGHKVAEFLHPDDLRRCLDYLGAVLASRGRQNPLEYRVRHANGEWRWHTANGVALEGAAGEQAAYLGIARDVTEQKRAEARIARLAHYDPLTDLPNRVLVFELAEQALRLAARQGTQLALLFVDLDHFKPVNDRHGHAVGDLLLKQVAARMVGAVRAADVVARIGGDEFVVLLHRVDGAPQALVPAGKIVEALRQPFAVEGLTLHISCCVGVALYPDHGTDMVTLARHADQAMYAAKHAGRDRVRLFDPALDGEESEDEIRA
ncbi:MAG TPA: diguanylate cyclase [Porticoccaceae bacterium]|nr:diguanylate cyclase [Porticoccaceae bacterium]